MFESLTQCISSKAELVLCLSSLSSSSIYATIIAVLIVCGFGVPIPEDITLIIAGVLSGLSHISLSGAMLVGVFGVLIGDATLFFIGRRLGKRVYKVPLFNRLFSEDRILKAEERVKNNSKFICFIARFLPGLRAPIYLVSGAMGVRPRVFLLLDGFAALISVPIWIYLGYWLGDKWDENWAFVKQMQGYLLAAVIIVIVIYWIIQKYLNRLNQKTKASGS